MQIEVKVKITNTKSIEKKIKQLGAKFWKETTEKDTYFHSQKGVFKVKESSDGECILVHDYRPKESNIAALRTEVPLDTMYAEKLKGVLQDTVGVQLILEKKRKQYIYHGVLLAIDAITHHDTFFEITSDEIPEKDGEKEKQKLIDLLKGFGFSEKDLETKAYNDVYLP